MQTEAERARAPATLSESPIHSLTEELLRYLSKLADLHSHPSPALRSVMRGTERYRGCLHDAEYMRVLPEH